MDFFKVLAGAAIGVGAVAAAPFTGGGSVLGAATLAASLAGAGTIAAAVGVGAAGAAAGATADYLLREKEKKEQSDRETQAKNEGVKAGEAIAAKKYEARIKAGEQALARLAQEMEQFQKDTREYRRFCEQLVAMFGVGIAVAHCDGNISDEEQEKILECISGISGASYPHKVLQSILSLEQNPPSFDHAVKQAKEAGLQKEIIDYIVISVAKADYCINADEKRLINKWEDMSYAIQ